MIPILSGNVASALGGGYEVANSCRFNDDDAPDLTRSKGASETSLRLGTFSFWIKRANITGTVIYSNTVADDNNRGFISINETLRLADQAGGGDQINLITTQVFRDPSAWSHIVIAIDTTQSTNTNRVKFYHNGTQITSFGTTTYPDQNDDLKIFEGGQTNKEVIGGINGTTSDGEFYLAEFVYIDGQQLAPTSFGEFDEDSPTIWKPKDVSGLTFGNQGFYLDFEDSSSLGNDAAGSNNFGTVNNLAATDQSTDTPTNNFCTLNPLDSYWESSTFSEGNLKIVTESTDYSYNTSTIGLTAGKWYCEVYIETSPHSSTKDSMLGIAGRMSEASQGYLGLYADTYGIYGGNGNIYNNGSASYGVSHTTGDIIGIYLDLDNNKLYFAKNGTIMNGGTGKSITAASATTAGAYFMVAADFYNGLSGTYRMNFGNPIYSLSSANADANGYGSFEYDPSSGTFDSSSKDFYAICTKNLAEFGG